jgi:hypothetical protein
MLGEAEVGEAVVTVGAALGERVGARDGEALGEADGAATGVPSKVTRNVVPYVVLNCESTVPCETESKVKNASASGTPPWADVKVTPELTNTEPAEML